VLVRTTDPEIFPNLPIMERAHGERAGNIVHQSERIEFHAPGEAWYGLNRDRSGPRAALLNLNMGIREWY
jgi:hypothetical protein